MMNKALIRSAIVAAALAGVAATASAETTSADAAHGAANTITLVGQNDLRFSKSHITVTPGQRVTIKLVNNSHLPASAMSHNWVLLKKGTDASAFDQAAESASSNGYFPKKLANETIAHTAMVAGGHSASVTFTAPSRPGNYVYLCTFPGHYGAGMKGTLTVKQTP